MDFCVSGFFVCCCCCCCLSVIIDKAKRNKTKKCPERCQWVMHVMHSLFPLFFSSATHMRLNDNVLSKAFVRHLHYYINVLWVFFVFIRFGQFGNNMSESGSNFEKKRKNPRTEVSEPHEIQSVINLIVVDILSVRMHANIVKEN